MSDLINAILEADPLATVGLVSGLLCVWLLIKQNIWTFPIGLVYAAVSVVVFTEQRLYADVLLSGYYVLMNGYGWYYWVNGRRQATDDELVVGRIPLNIVVGLVVLVVIATLLMGWYFDTQTDADLAYWDSTTTILSFAAMWMTARKYIENWIIWLVIDVMLTCIYFYKGIGPYTVLYAIYLVMAVFGWIAWQRSMVPASSSA